MAPATITQYLSHVTEYLKVRGISAPVRSVGTAVLLECVRRQVQAVASSRLTDKIKN